MRPRGAEGEHDRKQIRLNRTQNELTLPYLKSVSPSIFSFDVFLRLVALLRGICVKLLFLSSQVGLGRPDVSVTKQKYFNSWQNIDILSSVCGE
jgi:hypothetical protein